MRIAQSDKYEGNDWWSWAVWIEATADELKNIEAVTYTLHPTFADPVRRVTDRRSKFKLKEAGWGGFTIYARLAMKTGKKRNLKRELTLYYPEGEEAESVTISVNDAKQPDPSQHIETLQRAIQDAAPDATVAPETANETAAGQLKVQLTGPSLYSIAKGIQGWLSGNPEASLNFHKGEIVASNVTASNVLNTLTNLKA